MYKDYVHGYILVQEYLMKIKNTIQLFMHAQISTVLPMKFRKQYKISPNTLPGVFYLSVLGLM